MKTPRFSELDLARLVAIARTTYLEPSLRAYRRKGGASWSYSAVRASTSDILGARIPLYGSVGTVAWTKLERQISSACKHGDREIASNVEVARALFDEARRAGWSSVTFPMARMPIGAGGSVRYWHDVVVADSDGPFIPYFDHRKDNGVTDEAIMQVVVSMQNVWVRERNPDLAAARLAVVRFGPDAPRSPTVTFSDGIEMLSYDELNDRVRLVYEAWDRILREPMAPARRTGTDDEPSFLDGTD